MGHNTKGQTYWRGGVVLDIGGHRTLVRGDTGQAKVFVTVQGLKEGRQTALNVVRQQFQALHDTMPSLAVEARVTHPENHRLTVSYAHLLRMERGGARSHHIEGARNPSDIIELLNSVTDSSQREKDRLRLSVQINNWGDTHVNQNSGNIVNSKIDNSQLNWGTISGTVTNAINAIPPARGDAPDIKAVLDAFLAALKEASEKEQLQGDDPKDAADAVKDIADAAKEPEVPAMAERANKAVRGLGRIVGGVAALAAKFGELKAAVTGWFS